MRKRLSILIFCSLFLGVLTVNTTFLYSEAATELSISTQPKTAVVYVGEAVKLSVAATGGTKLSYQWYLNSSNSTSNGMKITGANSTTYAPPTAKVGSTYYYCKVFSTGTITSISTIVSNAASVTVKALPVIKTQPEGLSVYGGEAASLSVSATGSGTLSYQWYSNTTKSTSNAVKIPNTNSATYAVPTTAAGSLYYFCVVTSTDSAITTAPAVSVATSIVKVTVTASSSTAPLITSQPTSSVVYLGSSVQLSVSAAANGTLSYQWYKNASNSADNSSPIDGATKAVYTPPTSDAGLTYYYCVITNTPSTGTETYRSTSAIVSCTVKPVTVISKEPQGLTAYLGDTAALSVEATGSGTLSYQWYKNATKSTAGGTIIPDATAATLTIPTSTTSSFYYYCVVKAIDTTITTSVKASAATSGPVQVFVYAKSASSPVISAQSSSWTVYAGTAKQLSVTATGTGALSYQWYSSTAAGTEAGRVIDGATSPTYTVPNTTDGTTYYYCQVKNTVDTASGHESTTAVSAISTLTVLPLPKITAQPVDTVICSGSSATLNVTATGSGTLSYQWYSKKNTSATGTRITGATGASYTIQTDTIGITYYFCIIGGSDQRITESVKTASVTSSTAKVTVLSADTSAPIIVKQPLSTAVTAGTPASLTVTATGTGILSYQWYSNTTPTISSASPIAGATAATYNPHTEAASKAYYYCLVTNTDPSKTGTTSKSLASSWAVITVNSREPVIVRQPASTRLYTDRKYTLSVSATGAGTLSYQWYLSPSDTSSGGTLIAGAKTATYAVPTASAGTFYYYCVVTNTVKQTSQTITGTTASSVARIEVVPPPVITEQPQDLTVISGSKFTLTVAATGTGPLTYQWYYTAKPTATGSPIKNATKPSLTLTSTAATATRTAYYYCTVTSTDEAIKIGPKATTKSLVAGVTLSAANAAPPVITKNPLGQSAKVDSSVALSISAKGSGTLTYQWYSNSKSSTAGATLISGATASTLTVPTSSVGLKYYYCVVTNTDSALSGAKSASVTSAIVQVTVKAK